MSLTNHVAIFGGSFDPPHIGHQIAALWLVSALNAKTVVVAPTYEHCLGKKLVNFDHRLEMCHMMCELLFPMNAGGDDYDRREVWTSDVEIRLPRPNTTYNLINEIKTFKEYEDQEIAVIIGSDLVPEVHKWHEWDKVAESAKIVALGRSGFEGAKTPLKIYQYPIELSAISSSEVRSRVSEGKPITGLVPHNVERYIYEKGLYT
jgi:nicotinate-nucleotide adenylyltransferase